MSVTATTPIEILSPEQARQAFDEKVRALMQMSGEDFLRHLEAGDYADVLDDPAEDVGYLALLSRVVRQ